MSDESDVFEVEYTYFLRERHPFFSGQGFNAMGPIPAHKSVVGSCNPNKEFMYLWLNELVDLLP
jgi:hypothetical protein